MLMNELALFILNYKSKYAVFKFEVDVRTGRILNNKSKYVCIIISPHCTFLGQYPMRASSDIQHNSTALSVILLLHSFINKTSFGISDILDTIWPNVLFLIALQVEKDSEEATFTH